MPKDYKRALRELAERQAREDGEPGCRRRRARASDGAVPYMPAGGHEEASTTGEAGQYEDASKAAERASQNGAGEQAAGEAGERVLPSHG